MYEATLTFPFRAQAEEFAQNWSRHSLTGHTVSAGAENVNVTVYEVTDALMRWINNYVSTFNLGE